MNASHYDNKKLEAWRKAKSENERRQITQEVLAKELGCHRNKVVRAENGILTTYEFLVDLARYYGKPVTALLYDFPENEARAA